jgi:hypothetical protein
MVKGMKPKAPATTNVHETTTRQWGSYSTTTGDRRDAAGFLVGIDGEAEGV